MQQGTPKEVCRQPNSAFVMRFLGDANRVSGVARGGKVYVGDNELPFSYGQADGAVEIYARPSDWNGKICTRAFQPRFRGFSTGQASGG